MADDLRFLNSIVQERASEISRALPAHEGHGATLSRAVDDTLTKMSAEAQSIAAAGPYTPAEERANLRELQRLVQEIGVLYLVVAQFAGDIGRSDVPMGLLYLVDELIHDLLTSGTDPLVHLDQHNMYSTMSVFHWIPTILDPAKIPEPHPVAFNVPGLDPVNALFTPILVHEVGHTCWQRGLGTQLQALLDVPAIEAELNKAVHAGVPPQLVMERFESWLQELMCDALAATLTGPSFLFASAVFLPAIGQAILGSHPYPRDRIAFALRVLDRHGWTQVLQSRAQDVFAWCEELVANPELAHAPLEEALRNATKLAEIPMMDLAETIASNGVTSAEFMSAEADLFGCLDLEIPPVSRAAQPITPWLLVTAGWLHEIQRSVGEGPSALPRIASDKRLNRFLLKSIELSGIVSLWGSRGASTP